MGTRASCTACLRVAGRVFTSLMLRDHWKFWNHRLSVVFSSKEPAVSLNLTPKIILTSRQGGSFWTTRSFERKLQVREYVTSLYYLWAREAYQPILTCINRTDFRSILLSSFCISYFLQCFLIMCVFRTTRNVYEMILIADVWKLILDFSPAFSERHKIVEYKRQQAQGCGPPLMHDLEVKKYDVGTAASERFA